MKTSKMILLLACAIITSCGSFGEGVLAALGGYNPYGYGYGSPYSSGGNMNYLLDPNYAAAQATANGSWRYAGSSSSSSSSSSSGSSYGTGGSTSTRKKDCSSLRVNGGKWYCANTGKCGMCGGDGRMDGSYGSGANSLKCTLCNGTGKCKYCH